MINYNPKSWITLIFAIHKSDTLRMLWKELIYMGLFTLVVAYVEITFFPNAKNLDKLFQVYSLVGFVISLLLVFRTNTAYDRWWEGRKKWGDLVNDSRSLSVKLNSFLKEKEDIEFFKRMIINFSFATKEHLRKGVTLLDLDLKENELKFLEMEKHIPLAISDLMYQRIFHLKNKKLISEIEYLTIDNNLNNFMNVCGACERIKNTPIPFSYSLFLKKFIFIYVVTLPIAFVTFFSYYSALIATFVFYVLVSMEVLAEEIEDPFGSDDNDLPTDELVEKIKLNVNQVFQS